MVLVHKKSQLTYRVVGRTIISVDGQPVASTYTVEYMYNGCIACTRIDDSEIGADASCEYRVLRP